MAAGTSSDASVLDELTVVGRLGAGSNSTVLEVEQPDGLRLALKVSIERSLCLRTLPLLRPVSVLSGSCSIRVTLLRRASPLRGRDRADAMRLKSGGQRVFPWRPSRRWSRTSGFTMPGTCLTTSGRSYRACRSRSTPA